METIGNEDSRARAVARSAFEKVVTPPERLNVAQWAARRRIIGQDSTSPHKGPWKHDRSPYLIEVMECLSADHPARDVVFMKSAQIGASETAINLVLSAIDTGPRPILYVLPSIDEAHKFNRTKLNPAIKATPSVRHKVSSETVRGEPGSTSTYKKFRGGQLMIANAHSSAAMQMISAAILVLDEVSEYPADVGGRGDPVDLAIKRTLAFSKMGVKRFYLSTPAAKGSCRIEAKFAESDQRRYYAPCPECGYHQRLEFSRLRWDRDRAPHGAHFFCAANGCVIEQRHHERMIRANDGRLWVKCYLDDEDPEGNPAPPVAIAPEDFERWRARQSKGREPGFHIWQAYSLFVDWDEIVSDHLAAQGKPEKMRVFTQQVLGEPYEEKGEAPDAEKLFLLREQRSLGRIPPGALILTGAVDVQGDRLEWAVYGWGRGLAPHLVDKGVLAGDTSTPAPWLMLDEVRVRTWPDANGAKFGVDLWLIDAGYRSPMVYHYCRTHGGLNGKVAPIMGESSQGGRLASVQPIISTPKKVEYEWDGRPVEGGVIRYDLGTWPLKQWLYDGLRQTLRGPGEDGSRAAGAISFAQECDLEFFEQITAEYLAEESDRSGRVKRMWRKRRDRNEQHDLACYNRAAAELLELGRATDEDWARLARQRGAPQLELFGPAADIRREMAPKDDAAPKRPAVRGAQPKAPAATGGGWLDDDDLKRWT